MNEMTLPSGHRIRNSSPGGPGTSTLPLCQGGSPQYTRDLLLFKQAALTTAPGHPLHTGDIESEVQS